MESDRRCLSEAFTVGVEAAPVQKRTRLLLPAEHPAGRPVCVFTEDAVDKSRNTQS